MLIVGLEQCDPNMSHNLAEICSHFLSDSLSLWSNLIAAPGWTWTWCPLQCVRPLSPSPPWFLPKLHLHLQTYFNYCVRLKEKDTLHIVLCVGVPMMVSAQGGTRMEKRGGWLAALSLFCLFHWYQYFSILLHWYQYTRGGDSTVAQLLFCTFTQEPRHARRGAVSDLPVNFTWTWSRRGGRRRSRRSAR